MTPHQELAEQYRHVSRLWDGPRTPATCSGICFTFAAPSEEIGSGYCERFDNTCYRLRQTGILTDIYIGPEGEERPLRATVAALLAAMIESGDDPLDWTDAP